MSHAATDWAMRQRGLKPATKIVLFCLADRHNPDYGCFPNHKTLAADAEMSERSVRDHLEILEEKGLIQRCQVPRRNGEFTATRYILGFEDQRQILPSANPASGEIASPPTANSAAHLRQILPTNPVIEPRKGTSKKMAGLPFDAFWKVWPNKVAKSQAERAWAKMDAESREVAAARCQSWFDAWRKANPQASAIHPASFLNQRRWEDMDEATPAASPLAAAEYWAKQINNPAAFIPQSAIGPALASQMVSAGLVTPETLKRRGFAA